MINQGIFGKLRRKIEEASLDAVKLPMGTESELFEAATDCERLGRPPKGPLQKVQGR